MITREITEESFICSITKERMIDPVITRYGHSFECSVIIDWINVHGTCPITRKPLFSSDLKVDHELRKEMGLPEIDDREFVHVIPEEIPSPIIDALCNNLDELPQRGYPLVFLQKNVRVRYEKFNENDSVPTYDGNNTMIRRLYEHILDGSRGGGSQELNISVVPLTPRGTNFKHDEAREEYNALLTSFNNERDELSQLQEQAQTQNLKWEIDCKGNERRYDIEGKLVRRNTW